MGACVLPMGGSLPSEHDRCPSRERVPDPIVGKRGIGRKVGGGRLSRILSRAMEKLDSIVIIYDNKPMQVHDVSRKLRQGRLRSGLSLSQLARRADTSSATLSRYENGWGRFELHTLRKLATALGCRLVVDLVPIQPLCSPPDRVSGFRKLKRLFWDRKLRQKDLETYPIWILERVLEYGSLEDLRFLIERWGRRAFLERVAQARFQSAKTETFWNLLLQREGISCTKKFCRRAARPCWPG